MPDERNRLNQLRADALDVCTNVGVHPFEVELIVWPGDGDVGHTAIRIGDLVLGYYPTDLDGNGSYDKKDVFGSPGKLHVDTIREARLHYFGQDICVFSLSVTCQQLVTLIDFHIELLGKLGTYSLLSRNCTTIAVAALTKAGIDLSTTADIPNTLLGDFRRSYSGTTRVVDPGFLSSTVRFEADGIIAPTQVKPRTRNKDFVIATLEETVGQQATGAGK